MHPTVIDTVEFPVHERPEAWAETKGLALVTQRVKFWRRRPSGRGSR
ncbi:hypothetical protein [Streptomyces lydicus]